MGVCRAKPGNETFFLEVEFLGRLRYERYIFPTPVSNLHGEAIRRGLFLIELRNTFGTPEKSMLQVPPIRSSSLLKVSFIFLRRVGHCYLGTVSSYSLPALKFLIYTRCLCSIRLRTHLSMQALSISGSVLFNICASQTSRSEGTSGII
jgi:hypothetical protein